VNNPKGINIDRNAITCVDAISGTIPVNAGFNFRIPGTLSGRITNNIFSMFNDGSTTPPAGEFRVRKWPFKGGFVGVAGSPTAGVLYTGNLYFVGQRVWKSLTGGAGSEVVTTTGRTIEFDFTNYRWRLSQDGNAHTPQIIVFQGGGGNWLNPNQVTIGCSANITAGIEVVVEMDG
jgi:hypothetical protein